MEEFNILGSSNATISMILESLYRIYQTQALIKIIENTPVDDTLPFAIDGLETSKVFHEDWNYQEDMDRDVKSLSGVYRPVLKKKLFDFFRTRYQVGLESYANLVHPAAELAATALLYKGLNIGPHATIAPYVALGNLVTLNRSVNIGHHTVVGDYCTINPGANVAGRCDIGPLVTIGMGSNVVDGISIGEGSTVGAGTLVTKDVPPNVLVVGFPAKIVRSF